MAQNIKGTHKAGVVGAKTAQRYGAVANKECPLLNKTTKIFKYGNN